jgi:hypothetical protein
VNVENTVSIEVEGDFDLRGAAGSWWDALKVELSEEVAILGHLMLTLEDLEDYTRLVVKVCGEGLGPLGWDNGVSGDENSHDTFCSLDTQGMRNDIEKQHILDPIGLFTIKNGGLDGGALGNGFIL